MFGVEKEEMKEWYYDPQEKNIIISHNEDYKVKYKYDGQYLIEMLVGDIEWDKYSRRR